MPRPRLLHVPSRPLVAFMAMVFLVGQLASVTLAHASSEPGTWLVPVEEESSGLSAVIESDPFLQFAVRMPFQATIQVRTGTADAWSPWEPVAPESADHAPEDGLSGDWIWSALHWTGEATRLQLRGPALEDMAVRLLDPRRFPSPSQTFAAQSTDDPEWLITRAEWGADETWRGHEPHYADEVRFAVVHHTAGSNTYVEEDVDDIIRGIYWYHTHDRGWSDIAYNFLVDKFGRIHEGRFGGASSTVIGAHARDYNTGSTGVSILGDFTETEPSTLAVDAVARVLAWKFDVHGISRDPHATTQTFGGKTVDTVVGHRDVGSTACPGEHLYAHLHDLRHSVEVVGIDEWTPMPGSWVPGPSMAGWYREGIWELDGQQRFGFGAVSDTPLVGDWDGDGASSVGVHRDTTFRVTNRLAGGMADSIVPYGGVGDIPVIGDWDGDGTDTPGVVRDGLWLLSNSLDGGETDVEFHFGAPTDTPVVGDWDGDGVDTPGVHRGNSWRLRNELSGGSADLRFHFGDETDLPVVGDWDGDGVDTVGIVREISWRVRNTNSAGFADAIWSFAP